jgi:replicative DNA helicase
MADDEHVQNLSPAQVLERLSDGDPETKRFIFEDLLKDRAREYCQKGYKPADMLPLLLAENKRAGKILNLQQIKRLAVQTIAEERENLKPGSLGLTPLEASVRQLKDEVAGWGSSFNFEFGIQALDESFGGVVPGETLVLVGAQGSMKTSLLLNGIEHYIKTIKDAKVLLFSLDMPARATTGRLLCRRLKVNEKQLWRYLNDKDEEYLAAEQSLIRDLGHSLVLKENNVGHRHTIDMVRREIELEMPTLVAIDYLTKLKRRNQSDLDCVSECMPDLVEMAAEYGIQMILLSQMSRTAKTAQATGVATGGNAKGGGDVEDMANAVIDLFRDYPDGPGNPPKIIATVSKTRRGVSGKTFALGYWGTWMEFDGSAKTAERDKERKPLFKVDF